MSTESTDEDEAVAQAREEVINAMARTAKIYGSKQSFGRLYGYLFFADDLLSLDELSEQSGYAKSTVSTAMKTLERYHLVNRRSIPGEGKKAYYEAEDDLWYAIQRFLDEQVSREVDVMSSSLDKSEQLLEDADSKEAQRHREQIQKLNETYEHAQQMIDMLSEVDLQNSDVLEQLAQGR